MYTDCLDHRDYNLHVHVIGNDVLEFKYPLAELLISDTNFEKAVTEIKECYKGDAMYTLGIIGRI